MLRQTFRSGLYVDKLAMPLPPHHYQWSTKAMMLPGPAISIGDENNTLQMSQHSQMEMGGGPGRRGA